MDLHELRQQKNILFDFYETLLTEKQRDIFTAHYMDDHSLAEIANEKGTTPQAVADMLKRTNKQLLRYDQLLGLVQRHQTRQTAIAQIYKILDNMETHETLETEIKQIRKMLETMEKE